MKIKTGEAPKITEKDFNALLEKSFWTTKQESNYEAAIKEMNNSLSKNKLDISPVWKRKPILNNEDFYWEIGDEGEDDGFIHIVCTIDGSEIKIPLKGLK